MRKFCVFKKSVPPLGEGGGTVKSVLNSKNFFLEGTCMIGGAWEHNLRNDYVVPELIDCSINDYFVNIRTSCVNGKNIKIIR